MLTFSTADIRDLGRGVIVAIFTTSYYRQDAAATKPSIALAGSAPRGTTVPIADITRAIFVLRRQRIILDADLAALYGVTTKRLNEQVKRNAERFPADFAFRLTSEEAIVLRSQSATSKPTTKDGRGGVRYRPFAFTEHGAIMAATILNSPGAVDMSLYVVRAFVRLRELLATNSALARKLDELEKKYQHHDQAITAILSALRELIVCRFREQVLHLLPPGRRCNKLLFELAGPGRPQ